MPERKKPFGRPTKYRKEMCEQAYEVLKAGGFRCHVCAELGIDEDTFGAWRKKHPDFSRAIKEGLKLSETYHAKTGIELGRGEREGNTAAWFICMKNAFGWSDKKEKQIDQNINLNITWDDGE